MKKFLLISLLLVLTLGLASCSDANAPLTEDQQAESYNMSTAKYKEMKDAAARMNMTIEEHMKMTATNWAMDSGMDMSDDSSMIEDDSDVVMPEWAHKMSDGTIMKADGTIMSSDETMMMSGSEAMSGASHEMSDGSMMEDDSETMSDDVMHVELMHNWDKDVAPHPSAEH